MSTYATGKINNTNLKEETLQALSYWGLTEKDILWVGCDDFRIPTDQFWELADTTYDNGNGEQYVAKDLLIVCDGGWLERHTDDGAEWWSFFSCPARPTEEKSVTSLISETGDQSLAKINGFEPKEDTTTEEEE